VIKYNGVEIGKVKDVQLDNNNPRNVIVYLNILSPVRINSQTYAIIKAQGITGMSYIDLRLPKSATSTTNLPVHNTPPYPVISSHPSLMYGLTEQAQSLTNNVQDISSQMKILLADENLAHISNTFANLDKISSSLASKSGQMERSLDNLVVVLENIKNNSAKLNETFENLNDLSKSLANTSNNTNKLILGMQNNTMQNVNAVLLPNLNQTIINMNQASAQLEQFLTILNQNPSVVVRGKVPGAKGPGE
jgi:phospholipid/cholesterol/gamma-HCH transport system substrate-binding protein